MSISVFLKVKLEATDNPLLREKEKEKVKEKTVACSCVCMHTYASLLVGLTQADSLSIRFWSA